jgi:hypothetical protein
MVKDYRYRPKPWAMILAGLFFAVCAYFLAQNANSNERSMIINHLIELTKNEATIFLWVLTFVSILFVVGAGYGVVTAFFNEKYISTDSNSICIPKSFKNAVTRIPFTSIHQLTIQEVSSQVFLHIEHENGKASIIKSHLPSNADFEEIIEFLSQKVPK